MAPETQAMFEALANSRQEILQRREMMTNPATIMQSAIDNLLQKDARQLFLYLQNRLGS